MIEVLAFVAIFALLILGGIKVSLQARSAATPRERQPGDVSSLTAALVVIAATVLIGWLVIGGWNWITDNVFGGDGNEPTTDTVTGRLVDFKAVDEANLEIQISLTNAGSEATRGQCTVEAWDASGPVGFDIFTTPRKLRPGENHDGVGSIRIEDEGAFRVREVKVKDCEPAD